MRELKKPVDKKFELLKHKLSILKNEEINSPVNYDTLCKLYDNSFKKLFEKLIEGLVEFNSLFVSVDYNWNISQETIRKLDDLDKYWKDEKFLKPFTEASFTYVLNGLKKGGVETFNIFIHLFVVMDTY